MKHGVKITQDFFGREMTFEERIEEITKLGGDIVYLSYLGGS